MLWIIKFIDFVVGCGCILIGENFFVKMEIWIDLKY